MIYGAHRSNRTAENLRTLDRFFAPLYSFSFDEPCAQTYGQIRADLERSGTPIRPNDLLIATIAIANDKVLVTANTREFGRVFGLKLENWEVAE